MIENGFDLDSALITTITTSDIKPSIAFFRIGIADRQVNKPRALTATWPNQIFTWDITYLPTRVKGIFLYLYLVMDI